MSRPTTVVSTEMSINVRQDLDKLRECLGLVGSEMDGTDSCDNSSTCSSDLQIYEEISRSQTQSSSLISDNSLLRTETSGTHKPEEYMKHHSLEAALVTNEMYQEALVDAVARLQLALINNQEKQAIVQSDLNTLASQYKLNSRSQGNPVQFKRWQVISAPYFKDFDGFPCPENIDAKTKRMNFEASPYMKKPHNWTETEKEVLSRAVKSNVKKNVMQPLMQRLEILCSKLNSEELNYSEKAEINRKIEVVKEELAEKCKLTDNQLLELSTRDIDWMAISISEFLGEISPENCELMWKNCLHPSIYKGNWTKKEDECLLECVKKHRFRDWDSIAKDLGSKRTAEQCIKRYNENLNPEMNHKGYWTEKENGILENAVPLCMVGDKINWLKVSSYLESRHPISIRQHWKCSRKPTIKKGPWLIEEDVVLLAGVRRYGLSFHKIYPLLPGRTYNQCRERYTSSLNLNVNFDKWTAEEDKKLIRLAKLHGTKWALISDYLEGRTPNMVMNRHTRILTRYPDAYDLVDLPDSEWPSTISQTNLQAMNRRRKAYTLLQKRAQHINTIKPGQKPHIRRTSRMSKGWEPNKLTTAEKLESRIKLGEEFRELLKNPEHVEFVMEEAKNILLQSPNTQGYKYQSSTASGFVDKALDDLLFPTLVCRKVKLRKQTALSGKQTLELEHAKVALYNALNVDIPEKPTRITLEDPFVESTCNGNVECNAPFNSNKHTVLPNKDIFCLNPGTNIEIGISFDPVQSISEVINREVSHNDKNNSSNEIGRIEHVCNQELSENCVKTNKIVVREKLFSGTILETLSRQCLGHVTTTDQSRPLHVHVLPPMKPTVQAFKLLVMERPRLAQVAAQTVDISLLRQITLTPSNVIPKCIQCQSPNNLFRDKSEQQDITILSPCSFSNNVECKACFQLQTIHSKYVAFKNKFLAMFFWPGLMSVVLPPSTSINPSPPYFIPPAALVPTMKRKRAYKRKTAPIVSSVIGNASESECDMQPMKKERKSRKRNEAPTRSSMRQAKMKNSV